MLVMEGVFLMNTYQTSQVAKLMGIHPNTVRLYEKLELMPKVERKENGYRVYTGEDIVRLKIIRSLRCANYSLSAILRMLNALSENPDIDIKNVIDEPKEDDDIMSACDKLMTSLNIAKKMDTTYFRF